MDPRPAEELTDLIPHLRGVIARVAGYQELDDLTQECCVRIVAAERLWSGEPGTFRAWVNAVARNVGLDRLRRRAQEPIRELAPEDEPTAPSPAISEPQVRWVLEQLALLPERDRAALELRYYEGLSMSDVGQRLGISQPAASKRVAAALERLRRRARLQGHLSAFLPEAMALFLSESTPIKIIAAAAGITVVSAAATGFFLPEPGTRLVADTASLARTSFAVGLDAPLDPERNLLWCASLPLAWDELRELVGGDVAMSPGSAALDQLNADAARGIELDPSAYVARAGRLSEGIVDEIQDELDDKFDAGRDPVLDEFVSTPDSLDLIAYAFLFKSLRFATVFEDLERTPISFVHAETGEERSVEVDAFGIGKLSASKPEHDHLREQVSVLAWNGPTDFVVQLHAEGVADSILLARLPAAESLGATWEQVRARIAASEPVRMVDGDSLRVPELDFHLTHRFPELIGGSLTMPGFEHLRLASLVQDLRLRLDEAGVVVKSRTIASLEASLYPQAKQLVFDRAFLLALAEPGAETPYLMAWVAQPEILIPIEASAAGTEGR